jgi:hypothetical protein
MVVINIPANAVIPTDLSRNGGMRGSDDPVMFFFFLYPSVAVYCTLGEYLIPLNRGSVYIKLESFLKERSVAIACELFF